MNPEIELVTYIINALVDRQHSFTIERTLDERGVLLSLTIDADQAGRIIGKKGSTAQAIRNLLMSLGAVNNARYSLKINVDDGGVQDATGE